MGRLRRNRCIPLALTAGNMVFWLGFRTLNISSNRAQFFSFVDCVWVQFPAFLMMGMTLVWTVYACTPAITRRSRYECILEGGILFVLYQQVYNLVLQRKVYTVSPLMEISGICAGALLGEWLLTRKEAERPSLSEETRISLNSISTFRSQLMGIAMLGVMLVHTRTTLVRYILPLDVITCLGDSGVDVFLFISGIGMVFALSKSTNVLRFYKRRMHRVFLEATPWIGLYSLMCVYLGKHGIRVLIANCLGVGFWVSKRGFNWYYSFILLLYLVTPIMYRLLRTKRRYVWTLAMIAASMAFLYVITDVFEAVRTQIAFSRFPVFLIGLLAGFWLKEGKTLSRGEYRSLFFLSGFFFLLAYAAKRFELDSVIASQYFCYCVAAPAACLPLSRLFSRLHGGVLMRFLSWTGENSLMLYIWNVIVTREYSRIVPIEHMSNGQKYLVAFGMIVVNYLIVLLLWKVRKRIARRMAI